MRNKIKQETTFHIPRGSLSGICSCRCCFDKQQTPDKNSRGIKEVEQTHLMSGLHPTYNSAGFTLIELLVVVLIIGILAAVALPQYQKTVEKTKATQALTLLQSVGQAADEYYLANGTEFSSFDELSIDIPWTGKKKILGDTQDSKANSEWTLEIEKPSTGDVPLYITRLNGKYKGAGFLVFLYKASRNSHLGKSDVLCFERKGGSVKFDTSLADGAYCVQIMKGTFNWGTDFQRAYKLPY